ncbi:hypothetical protein Gogos_008761 [Gossypium gossypioides]|uniref:Uncharacterized protein n=1 Tax=Gossypium gossypioides TaxID=34282 RepID=A0A7J9CD61_GOSGO|nr:hypothetical protein [Gossypium gossypioides]
MALSTLTAPLKECGICWELCNSLMLNFDDQPIMVMMKMQAPCTLKGGREIWILKSTRFEIRVTVKGGGVERRRLGFESKKRV